MLVGLGNPGSRYVGTRHNLGFEAVERIADAAGASWRAFAGARPALIAAGVLDAHPLLFFKPMTFMNLSGGAVAELLHGRDLEMSSLLVYYDDIALPLGTLRIRERGSDGGHQGLRSVLESLGSREVPRVRLGIGPPEPPEDVAEFVLSRFTADEGRLAEELLDRARNATRSILSDGMAKAMSMYNR